MLTRSRECTNNCFCYCFWRNASPYYVTPAHDMLLKCEIWKFWICLAFFSAKKWPFGHRTKVSELGKVMFCLQDPFQNLFSGSCSAERLRALWRVPRVIYKLHSVVLVGVACSAYNDDKCTRFCRGCHTCWETRNKLPCSQRRNYILYYTPQHTFSAPLPLSNHFRLFEIAFRLCRFIWMHKKSEMLCAEKQVFAVSWDRGKWFIRHTNLPREIF